MKEKSPYVVFENDYWKQPRDICVVEKINCKKNGNAEVICSVNPKNERWVFNLAKKFNFKVLFREDKDSLGVFRGYTVEFQR